MAASLEHLCNALGGGGNGLSAKAKSLWNIVLPGIQAQIDKPLSRPGGGRLGDGDEAAFRESCAVIKAAYADTGMEGIARDIRLAAIARNQILHEGIAFLGREEAIDLFILLFTLSFLTWHARTP